MTTEIRSIIFRTVTVRIINLSPAKGCSAALKTAGANSKAINDYYNLYQTPIGNAGSANGVDPRFLAAVGLRASGLPANPDGPDAAYPGDSCLLQFRHGEHKRQSKHHRCRVNRRQLWEQRHRNHTRLLRQLMEGE